MEKWFVVLFLIYGALVSIFMGIKQKNTSFFLQVFVGRVKSLVYVTFYSGFQIKREKNIKLIPPFLFLL